VNNVQEEQRHQAMILLLRTVRDAIDEYLQATNRHAASASPNGTSNAEADSAAFEEVRRAVIAAVIERTGYPEEMLDLDLDLEADLGIDTIKQVAIYGAARETWGLAPDPDFRLRDHNTLRKSITYIARRLPAATTQR
jgi:Phosphopantetheine attachment site